MHVLSSPYFLFAFGKKYPLEMPNKVYANDTRSRKDRVTRNMSKVSIFVDNGYGVKLFDTTTWPSLTLLQTRRSTDMQQEHPARSSSGLKQLVTSDG